MKSDFWDGYLRDGYFDENGNLRLGYVQRDRMEEFSEAIVNDRPQLTSTQLRRYFGHCRRIEARIRMEKAKHQAASEEAIWEKVRADFYLIDPVVENAFSARNAKLSSLFYEFLKRNVNAVKKAKDFTEGFMPHFEAFVGFGTKYTKKGE